MFAINFRRTLVHYLDHTSTQTTFPHSSLALHQPIQEEHLINSKVNEVWNQSQVRFSIGLGKKLFFSHCHPRYAGQFRENGYQPFWDCVLLILQTFQDLNLNSASAKRLSEILRRDFELFIILPPDFPTLEEHAMIKKQCEKILAKFFPAPQLQRQSTVSYNPPSPYYSVTPFSQPQHLENTPVTSTVPQPVKGRRFKRPREESPENALGSLKTLSEQEKLLLAACLLEEKARSMTGSQRNTPSFSKSIKASTSATQGASSPKPIQPLAKNLSINPFRIGPFTVEQKFTDIISNKKEDAFVCSKNRVVVAHQHGECSAEPLNLSILNDRKRRVESCMRRIEQNAQKYSDRYSTAIHEVLNRDAERLDKIRKQIAQLRAEQGNSPIKKQRVQKPIVFNDGRKASLSYVLNSKE
ncbi:hypothetical protein PHSC3_000503 [Chlamydiales bacterium STE3]|nr:hypothetical protein PHSC3_000503 [Chlamydiales bacterium STE3]